MTRRVPQGVEMHWSTDFRGPILSSHDFRSYPAPPALGRWIAGAKRPASGVMERGCSVERALFGIYLCSVSACTIAKAEENREEYDVKNVG
jgi:hypothetical protein